MAFKVMCISEGNLEDGDTLVVGADYTVIHCVEGWEVHHPDSSDIFYQLAEKYNGRVYHSKLFATISEIDETELIEEREPIKELV